MLSVLSDTLNESGYDVYLIIADGLFCRLKSPGSDIDAAINKAVDKLRAEDGFVVAFEKRRLWSVVGGFRWRGRVARYITGSTHCTCTCTCM